MAQKNTKTSSLRLLLNAEPFGFGPTAAIASFFLHLKGKFAGIGYIGKKHTLDLQRDLPYDAIHDVTKLSQDKIKDLFKGYDVFVTAMDHKMAKLAKKAGLKVIYYDALTWYWPEIKQFPEDCDLYIGQDFFGVKERLTQTFGRHADIFVVPPIVEDVKPSNEREHVLINLGGLQNPYIPKKDLVIYARQLVTALKDVIPKNEKVIIAGSKAIADKLGDLGVRTYPREEMKDILAKSKIAFMTPGLGNIYDAASYNIPTAWLPPANDSQGRQLDILKDKGIVDASIDWDDFLTLRQINYSQKQLLVLNQIGAVIKRLQSEEAAQERLSKKLRGAYKTISKTKVSKTTKLPKLFGVGGEKIVADLIVERTKTFEGNQNIREARCD